MRGVAAVRIGSPPGRRFIRTEDLVLAVLELLEDIPEQPVGV
jgi:hypothetical protein